MSLTAKLMLSPLLVAQAIATKARLVRLPEPAGPRQGTAGAASLARAGKPLRLLIAGDSSAAGVGVAKQRDALAHQLATNLAKAVQAQVSWHLLARSGLTTAQTMVLLLEEGVGRHHLVADVAVVVTGVNDVVDQVPSHRAVAAREAVANWLRNGCGAQHVVFAPLPPIHHFPGLPQPLRWVAGGDARRHNRALRLWTATRADVSCVELQMPLDSGVMAADGFHPGAPVYRYCAAAIAAHIARHVWPGLHLHLQPQQRCHA